MIELTKQMHEDFLEYAEEVNTERAFPDVRDGLKPSQRAVLWEMYECGYSSDKPHVKSAKVDGGVIARWHPHGSEYETLVRMSQNFVNNLPEIDFHGSNGSVQLGPRPAQSRYTECRMSKVSEDGLFKTIGDDTVEFIPNFSEDLEWPSVLPALMPRLFVNGSQGIGYTVAQEWEPGNLKEFTTKVEDYLNGEFSCKDIYPDYPTGGVIVNKKDIENVYKTGKGSIILRGSCSIEDNIIRITSLPYQVCVEQLCQEIKDLSCQEKINITDILNKSDDDGILVEVVCCDDANKVINKLFNLTDLQCTFSANMMAMNGGHPEMYNLERYIKAYIDHNIDCIVKEHSSILEKSRHRAMILEGMMRASDMIDDVIDVIRSSKSTGDARKYLIDYMEFTDEQAKAIVDMKLGSLSEISVEDSKKNLFEEKQKISYCERIIGSESLQKEEFLRRLKVFTNKYGWDRRTAVVDDELKKDGREKEPRVEAQVVIKLVAGNLLNIPLSQYKGKIGHNVVKTGERSRVVALSKSGKMYKFTAKKVPTCTNKSIGMRSVELFNDEFILIVPENDSHKYIAMVTNNNLVKKLCMEDFTGVSKNAGAIVMKLNDGDYINQAYCANDGDLSTVIIKEKETLLSIDDYLPKGRSAGGVAYKKVRMK